jgi:hypothetical protein
MTEGVAPERPTGYVLVGPPAGDSQVPNNRRGFTPDGIGPEGPLPRPDISKRLLSAVSSQVGLQLMRRSAQCRVFTRVFVAGA